MSDTTYTQMGDTDEKAAGSGPRESDYYETTEGDRVYDVQGGDWDTILAPPTGEKDRLIVNMGPQHPSTHGVLRLIV